MYRDWATGWTTGVRFPAEGRLFFFFSSPPLPDRLCGTPSLLWGSFPGGKTGREDDHSPPSDA